MNISVAQSPLDCSTSTVSACSGNPSFPFTMNTSTTSYGAIMDLPGNSTSSISNPATNPTGINKQKYFSAMKNKYEKTQTEKCLFPFKGFLKKFAPHRVGSWI